MTTPLDQTERDRFEAWFSKANPSVSLRRDCDHQDDYHMWDTDAAWEAWQAATASRAVPEGYVLAPLQPNKAMTDAAHQSARLEHEEEGEGCCGWFLDNPEEVYAAMLAAAPKETP